MELLLNRGHHGFLSQTRGALNRERDTRRLTKAQNRAKNRRPRGHLAKEVMPAKDAAGNHDGRAGYDEAGLGHVAEEEQEPRHLARL
jgi:hypothetical protein